jgi:hypothetical protein
MRPPLGCQRCFVALAQHWEHALAESREMRQCALAPKQLAPERAFEGLDGAGQGRLCDVAPFCRPGQIQRLADRQEITDFDAFTKYEPRCALTCRLVPGQFAAWSPVANETVFGMPHKGDTGSDLHPFAKKNSRRPWRTVGSLYTAPRAAAEYRSATLKIRFGHTCSTDRRREHLC